ncbi:MAG: hypothetical protein PHR94_16575 [Methylomonas lenta]|nr:hypothetical protein [Methylomonas lenta]
MIPIEPMALPAWLKDLTAEHIHNDSFPLTDILQDSLYYPGAGHDGKPVKWLSGNVYSFVYSDYGISKSSLLSDLIDPSDGFRGYGVLAFRDVTMHELIPNGWSAMMPDDRDGNPKSFQESIKQPYAIWAVLERLPEFNDEHGPQRFSLLYICCDGAAGYQALYNSNQIKPKILFMVNHGFGCNWTNFETPEKILARSARANSQGLPDFLIGRKKNEQKASYWPDDYPNEPLTQILDPDYFRLFESDLFVWVSKSKLN